MKALLRVQHNQMNLGGFVKSLIAALFLLTSGTSALADFQNSTTELIGEAVKEARSERAIKKVTRRCQFSQRVGDYGKISKLNGYKIYSVYSADDIFLASFQTKDFGITGLCVRAAE